jgi:thiamine-monophosphate kinase
MIDVTVVGTAKPRRVLTRSGARPGDELLVSGSIGAAAAGLRLLKRSTTKETSSVSSVVESCLKRFLYPEPRVRLGLMLARNRAATACVDLSDGLADAVRQLAIASQVGAIVDAGALPIEPEAKTILESGGDPVTEAISGGDDYELLFSVKPTVRSRLRNAERHGDVSLMTRIGLCTKDPALILRHPDSGDRSLPQGYSHFR